MPTHFILDKKLKEEQETVTEILRLTQKKPLDTKEAVHLYRFLNSCFIVVEEEKRQEEHKKEIAKERTRQLVLARLRQKEEEEKQKELAARAPEAPSLPGEIPSPLPELPALEGFELPLEAPLPQEMPVPMPELQKTNLETPAPKKEYILRLYDSAVGVLIDNETGNPTYNLIEPFLGRDIVNKARELFGKDFEKDNSLFDDFNVMKKVAQKTAEKMGLAHTDILTSQLRYYLERDILGAGIFDAFIADENIKTIVCDGPNRPIKIEYEAQGSMNTNVTCKDNEDINQFLRRVALATGKSINEKNPILSVRFHGLLIDATMGMGGASSKITIRRLKE